jgi:hypothetical protein
MALSGNFLSHVAETRCTGHRVPGPPLGSVEVQTVTEMGRRLGRGRGEDGDISREAAPPRHDLERAPSLALCTAEGEARLTGLS